MNPLSIVPHAWLRPLRRWAACRPRGSLLRNGAHLALQAAMRGRQLSGELTEIRPADRPDLSFEPVDSMVAEALYWFGVQGYEGRLGAIWPALCARSADTLEVGGNIGLYTVLGGGVAAGRYTVVEPLPALCALIRRNLARNAIAGVEVAEGAAVPGPDPAPVRLAIPDADRAAPVGAHLEGQGEVQGRAAGRVIEVAGLPFARLAAGRRLLKIDAEGVEAELLQDAQPVLGASRPVLLIEVLEDSERLAALLREIALAWEVPIHVVPGYGDDQVVRVDPAEFHARVPGQHRSKDVLVGDVPAEVLRA